MTSKYHLLINLYKILLLFQIFCKDSIIKLVPVRSVSASLMVFLVTLLDAYTAFHCFLEVMPSNLLSELFLSKFDQFHFIFLLHAYFHDHFIGTIHDIQCFTFTQL